MEVDVLNFLVPVENNKTVFVWNIQPGPPEAQIYVSASWHSLASAHLLKYCRFPSKVLQPPSAVCFLAQDGLYSVFSSFGPLYLLKVCPNAPLNPAGFYALIKFYSAAQASNAQRQTDGRSLFQSAALKVGVSVY